MKKAFILFTVNLFLATGYDCAWSKDDPVLHLYAWAYYVPKSVIRDFEKETGIRVIYDVFEGNDMLEAKLLTGISQYDVVCPSAWPYAGSQIKAKVYQQLQLTKIPNAKHIDPFLREQLKDIDPQNAFTVPYAWGISGIGLNVQKVRALMPNAPLDSWAILFDKSVVKQIHKCGLSLLEEAVDVIPAVLHYLGLDPNTTNEVDIQKAVEVLQEICPYISRFDAFQSANELGTNELCVVQGWSSEILRAKTEAEKARRGADIQFILPKEGAAIWIDVLAIPQNAPHPENAHAFLNFVLQPHIAARIVNEAKTAVGVRVPKELIEASLFNNPAIFPSEDVRKKLFINKMMPASFIRQQGRLWLSLKSGRHRTAKPEP